MNLRAKAASLAAAATVVAVPLGLSAGPAVADHSHRPRIQHVLLISVDGMHQSDLDW